MWVIPTIIVCLAVYGVAIWRLAHWAYKPGRKRWIEEMYPEGYEPGVGPVYPWEKSLRKHLRHPSPKGIRKLNGWLTVFWAGMIIPTVIWFHNSILWVAFLSIYANAATHYSAWIASRSEVRGQEVEDQVVTEQHVKEQHVEEE